MDFLPVFLDIRNRNCVVVGGGEVAARKVALLLRAGAHVTLVAPRLCEELDTGYQSRSGTDQETISRGKNTMCETFLSAHLADAALVIAATDDAEVNRKVSEAAKLRNIPVNVVDNPALCSFIMPSVVDRSPFLSRFQVEVHLPYWRGCCARAWKR